jgi:Concanavalin A-like lectin/glucanases superfamily
MRKIYLSFTCCLFTFFFVTAQVPGATTARYQLNNSGTDVGPNTYNATLSLTTGTTNRFNAANTAIALTAGLSSGTLPIGLVTATQNDFSIGFWFKTAMTGATGAQWYSGTSLVDGEVGGVTNDWGISLIDGGKVCFGVGNPDITIKSTTSSYNNNAWHFVTATRNKTAGTIILYVDGVNVASSSGINTGILNAPAVIGLGRSSAVSSGGYTGSLDDIIVYNRVLSAVDVSNAYTALSLLALPLKWVSFAGDISSNAVTLRWEVASVINNDRFEIEHSADGVSFTPAGSIADGDGTSTASGAVAYLFAGPLPAGNTHYYRIRQVDKDGSASLSKTIKLMAGHTGLAPFLQSNPVGSELVLINNQGIRVRRMMITDAGGRTSKDVIINANSSIIRLGTADLKPGFYLLRINGDGNTTTLPFIKN